MKEALRTKPYFVLLLPLFFVLHGFIEFFSFMKLSSLFPFLIGLFIASALLFLVFRITLKNNIRAGLMTVYMMGFYLFFGALFDFLKAHSPFVFLYRYRTLVGAFLIFGTLLFFYFRKTRKDFSRLTLFLNVLLLLFLVIDTGTAIYKGFNQRKQPLVMNTNPGNGLIPDTCAKPDIYLLVFDGYSSTYGMKQFFGYDNSKLDSFLVNRRFRVFPMARSNYPATVYSMASCLNMDYLHWLNAGKKIVHEDYVQCGLQIYDNEVARFLQRNGYEIANHSLFDLKEQAAPVKQRWRMVNANLVSQGTFLPRFVLEFHLQLTENPTIRKFLPVFAYGDALDNNEICLKGVQQEALTAHKKPKFVYGHFLMPHAPYYMNREGKQRTAQEMADPPGWENETNNPYTEYAQYTNGRISRLIDSIQTATAGKAVIMLLSDHGFHMLPRGVQEDLQFYNLSAVYLPNQQYQQYSDSVTNVNQFRILFNTLFKQQYPIIKDSFIHFTYRAPKR